MDRCSDGMLLITPPGRVLSTTLECAWGLSRIPVWHRSRSSLAGVCGRLRMRTAVRQDQRSALPFAGGRLQEYDELPVKIVREGAALLVELFQLHTVVIDHLIGGYGTVLVEDQLQGLRPAVYLFLLVRIQAAAVDRQDVRLSDVL